MLNNMAERLWDQTTKAEYFASVGKSSKTSACRFGTIEGSESLKKKDLRCFVTSRPEPHVVIICRIVLSVIKG